MFTAEYTLPKQLVRNMAHGWLDDTGRAPDWWSEPIAVEAITGRNIILMINRPAEHQFYIRAGLRGDRGTLLATTPARVTIAGIYQLQFGHYRYQLTVHMPQVEPKRERMPKERR